jgi:hypothetical protein
MSAPLGFTVSIFLQMGLAPIDAAVSVLNAGINLMGARPRNDTARVCDCPSADADGDAS